MEAWYATALDIEEVLTGATDSDIHLFVADEIKSFDTVDRSILRSNRRVTGTRKHQQHQEHQQHYL